MPRSEKLPANVTSFVDRHGRRRYRWRSKGRQVYFHAHPNSAEGAAELAAILAERPAVAERRRGTIGWLASRYLASLAFTKNKGDGRRHSASLILGKFVREYADELISEWNFQCIEAVLAKTAAPGVTAEGRRTGGPHAALNLRDQLRPMFRYAMKLGLIGANPVDLADTPTAPKGGYHTWTEDEIATYRAHHAIGTTPRLALEIMLWTAQRKSDAAVFGPRHLKGKSIHYTAAKTGTSLWLPAAPQLLAAISAMPVVGTETFLVTAYGQPFSSAGLGNRMREWCDAAGLPQCTAHGLRKALARRAAEAGASNQRLKALGGWKGDREVALYTAAVEQAAMAEAALAPVIAADLATRF